MLFYFTLLYTLLHCTPHFNLLDSLFYFAPHGLIYNGLAAGVQGPQWWFSGAGLLRSDKGRGGSGGGAPGRNGDLQEQGFCIETKPEGGPGAQPPAETVTLTRKKKKKKEKKREKKRRR